MNGTAFLGGGRSSRFARSAFADRNHRIRTRVRTVSMLSAQAPLDVMEWDEAGENAAAWRELAAVARDPNVFLEPAFALAAAQHLPAAERPRFLMVRCGPEAEAPLAGLFAIAPAGRGAHAPTRTWLTPNTTLGVPLLRPGFENVALDALHAWLRQGASGAPVVVFSSVDPGGPTAGAILAHAAERNLPVERLDLRERAALHRAAEASTRPADGKRRRELKRLIARLAEKGTVTMESARTPEAVRHAMEVYLRLEEAGWKGAAGTAFLRLPALATFARTMSRSLAAEGKFRVETMLLDGRPIAAGLVLTSGRHAAFWKMTYDEDFAAFAPGIQLTVALGAGLMDGGDFDLVDSCAIPDHPTLDRYWLGRRSIVDLAVGAEADRSRFDVVVRRERTRRRVRMAAKAAWARIQRWRY